MSKITWRGDFYGGVTAAIVALPLALAFGVAAYSALGPEYASRGALAGLLGQPNDRLFFVWCGKLALWQEWQGTMIRMTSAAAGSVVGWRALLEPEYQYLDVLVRAESDGLAYMISQAELQSLAVAHPLVYIHLQQEVLRYIFDRIQILNIQLALLEEQTTFNHE